MNHLRSKIRDKSTSLEHRYCHYIDTKPPFLPLNKEKTLYIKEFWAFGAGEGI